MAITFPKIYVETEVQLNGYFGPKLRFNLAGGNDAIIEEHLDLAEGKIDAFLSRRFVLPLENPPGTPVYFASLRGCAFAFMHETLETRKQELNDDTREIAQACRDWLELVAQGKASIGDETGLVFVTATSSRMMTFSDRYFTDGREVDDEDTTTSPVGIEPNFDGTGTTRVS